MEILTAAELLAALGHESRLAIFRLLVQAGSEGMMVGAIADKLSLPGATLSFHLAHLSRVGLIKGQRQGRVIHYSTEYHLMDDLLAFLTANCCQGQPCLPKTTCCPSPVGVDHSATGAPLMDQPKTVLVLCTGNSCRSQMAESIINHDLAGRVRCLSAGVQPQPAVAAGAIKALKLAGLPTTGLHPKTIEAVWDEQIDLVVTVCDHAHESCPVFPRPVKRIHIGFHDPHGEPLERFVEVRDDIRSRLVPIIKEALGG